MTSPEPIAQAQKLPWPIQLYVALHAIGVFFVAQVLISGQAARWSLLVQGALWLAMCIAVIRHHPLARHITWAIFLYSTVAGVAKGLRPVDIIQILLLLAVGLWFNRRWPRSAETGATLPPPSA